MSPEGGPVRLPACFGLAETLDCGQAFRWRRLAESPEAWQGTAFGRVLRLRRLGGELELSCTAEEFEGVWRRYFDLDEDYAAIQASLAELSPALREAVAYAPGIRILRQEPWEALCSFILSQNNNIARIKGIVERFCGLFGSAIPGEGQRAFPGAEKVAALSLEALGELRAGYRAAYVLDAARKVADGSIDLKRVAEEPAEYGRGELRKIHGVGPKVAECALLYGFHKTECFPMDVWMKKAMGRLLPGMGPGDLGPYAGIGQQYIFHYSRMHPELFKEG